MKTPETIQKRFAPARYAAVILTLLALSFSSAVQARPVDTLVYIDPLTQTVGYGDEVTVQVLVDDVSVLTAYGLTLTYPPALLSYVSVANGGFLAEGLVISNVDEVLGTVQFDNAQVSPEPPKSGSGILLELKFTARTTSGTADLSLSAHDLVGDDYLPIEHITQDGAVQIAGAAPAFQIFLPLIQR